MGKIKNIFVGFFLVLCTEVIGQDQTMTNTGVTMVIQEGASIYVDGDYEDIDLEDGITLEGTFEITGDLYNNSNRGDLFNQNVVNIGGTDMDIDFSNSAVILSGSSNQSIGGSDASFFPNLQVNKTESDQIITMNNSFSIRNDLILTTGRINLNGNNITLLGSTNNTINATLIGEDANNYVYDNSGLGFIRKDETTFDPGLNEPGGLGLSFINGSGITCAVERRYQVLNNVADGSIALNYEMESSNPGQVISNVSISSNIGTPTTSDAIYFSTDQSIWDPYNVGVTGDGFITTSITPSSTSLTIASTNHFTIGVRNCSVSNQPNFTILSTVSIPDTDLDGSMGPDNNNIAGPPSAAASLNICEGSELALAPNNLDATQSYHYHQWSSSNGTLAPSNETNVDVGTVTSDDTYTLLARNSRGCEAEVVKSVTERDNPVASFTIDQSTLRVCVGSEIDFDASGSSVGDESNITSYNWNFGDGSTPAETTTNTASHTYNDSGDFRTTLNVTTEYGCTNSDQNEAFGSFPILNPPSIGTVGITLDGMSITESCEQELIEFDVSVEFTDIGGNDLFGHLQYRWDFGDENTQSTEENSGSSQVENTYLFTANNNFSVGLTVENTSNGVAGSYGCISTASTNVIIHPKPAPAFDILVDETIAPAIFAVCEGVDLDFANNSSIADGTATTDAIASYQWDFGNGETSTEINPSLQYIQENTHDIELIATSSFGCMDTTVTTFIVHPTPEGVAGTDIYPAYDDGSTIEREYTFCLGETTSFVNGTTIPSGGIAAYLWDFGDGSTSTQTSPEHIYSNPGIYPVSLTRTSDNGCDNTTSIFDVVIKDFPIASFEFTNQCDGAEFSFLNNSYLPDGNSDVTYFWDFGDGENSSEANPSHTYSDIDFGAAEERTFDVTLTVTNAVSSALCDHSITNTVTVYRNPSFEFPAVALSFDSQVTLDPLSDTEAYVPPGATYSWRNNVGSLLSTTSTYDAAFTGNYFLEVTSMESCAFTENIVVYLLEPVSLGLDQHLCENSMLDAAPSNSSVLSPTNHRWFRGVAIAQDGPESTIEITESGTYRVEVTYMESGVSAMTTDEVNVTIDLPVTLALDPQYSACNGELVSVDAGLVADTYSWRNALGTEIAISRIAQFDQAGTYSLEVQRGACSDAQLFEVVLFDVPVAFYSASISESCVEESITFTSFDNDGTISWDFGDGETTNGSQVVHAFESAGSFTVAMSITNASGCTEEYTNVIDVFDYPEASFTAENECENEAVTFDNQSNTFGGSISYFWNFDDGNSSSLENPTHTYNNAGTYEVLLTVMNNGCESSTTQNVTVYEINEIGFGAQVATCGDEVTLTAPLGLSYRWFDADTDATLSTDQAYTATVSRMLGLQYESADGCMTVDETEVLLNSPIEIDLGTAPLVFCESGELDPGTFPNATYLWSTGETTQRITVTSSGTYHVTVEDVNGCLDSESIEVVIVEQPLLDLGSDISVCRSELPIILQSTTTAESYLWSTGETTSSIEVITEGIYELQVSNGEGSCSDTDQITVEIYDSPVVNFDVGDVCFGEEIPLENISIGNDLSYTWDFGDGNSSPVPVPTHTYQSAGTYTVTLSAETPNGCSASVTKMITIHPVPIPDYAVSDGCLGTSFEFINNSIYDGSEEDLTYAWDFGDGNTASTKETVHEYAAEGTYLVRLTTTSTQGCSNAIVGEVQVFAAPTIDFGGAIQTCEREVVLDALNPGSSYLWQDNSTSQQITVTETGTYSVTVTSTSGCSITESVDVELLDVSKPNLGLDQEVCGDVELIANTNAVSYLWSTGETTPSIITDIGGTYTLQTISEDLCPSSDTIDVVVNAIPVFDLGADQQKCDGEIISLEIATGDSFVWSTGETSQSISAIQSGVIQATAMTVEGCEFSDEIELTFYDLPEKPFEESYEACDSRELVAGALENTYLWSTGTTDRALTINESGLFWVQITSAESCVTLDTAFVDVFPSPSIGFEESVEICFGGIATLDVGNGNSNNSIMWNTGESTQTIEVGSPGVYWADVTNTFGCTVRDFLEVIERPDIVLDLGADFVFCESVELNAGLDNVQYQWTLPDGGTQNTRRVTAEVEGTYLLTVTDDFGCTASDDISITKTTEKVDAHFLSPSIVLAGNRVVFQALSSDEVISYYWEFGDGNFNDENISNPVYRYNTPGNYTITLTYTNGICTETLSKEIEVIPRSGGRLDKDSEVSDDRLLFTEILESGVYPNPIRDHAILDVRLNTSAVTQIQIHDLAGHTYMNIEYEIQDESIGLDFTDYEAGVYMVSIKVGNQVVVEKILKVD